MGETVRDLEALAREFVHRARAVQVTFLAAAVTYYALVSLVPLLALALVVSAAVGGEALVEELLGRFQSVLRPESRTIVEQALVGGRTRVGASAIGTAVLVWSALKVLRALDIAFGAIYGRRSTPSLVENVLDGVIVLASIAVGIGLLAGLQLLVQMVPLGPFARSVAVFIGIATVAVVLVPMYVVFPNQPVGLLEAVPGALAAALGWMVLGSLFSVYVAVAGSVVLYGALGGILLLVTLLYFGAVCVMLGAVLNVTIATDRQLQQGGSRGSRIPRVMGRDPPADGDDAGVGEREHRPDRADDERRTGACARPGPADPVADGGRDVASPDGPGDPGDDGSDTSANGADSSSGGSVPSPGSAPGPEEFDPTDRSADERQLRAELEDLKDDLEDFRTDVEGRTVDRDAVERDLRRYVRRRVRRGHARGWGPYLVLLYGTAMTIGAFYFLSSGWAILAMVVIWLSTLGLYTLMVLVGFGLSILGLPGRVRDAIGDWRS